MALIVGDLFSGIGGFSLAAHWHGWRTAWFSEIDPYACRVLAKHWPDVPNLGDITKVDWSTVAPVDVLTGGFPCQPHSLAGKRLASSDERDLFSEIIRTVRSLRPRYILLENVRGLLTSESGRFFGRVLRELAECGYDAEWQVLSAADVGAPHRRERVWIVAYTATTRRGRWQDAGAGGRDAKSHRRRRLESERDRRIMVDATRGGRGAGPELAARWADGGCEGLGHAEREGQPQLRGLLTDERGWDRNAGEGVGDADDQGPQGLRRPVGLIASEGRHTTGRHGPASSAVVGWLDAVAVRGADGTVRRIPREAAEGGPESALWPVAHGVSGRVARLRGIGNSIVPRCAYEVMRTIVAMEQARVAA